VAFAYVAEGRHLRPWGTAEHLASQIMAFAAARVWWLGPNDYGVEVLTR
jgi:hypothetical protein